jgi:hypothetical protein
MVEFLPQDQPGRPAPGGSRPAARANGRLAFGACAWDEKGQAFVAGAVEVVRLRGAQVEEITAFRTPDASLAWACPAPSAARWQSRRPGRSLVHRRP